MTSKDIILKQNNRIFSILILGLLIIIYVYISFQNFIFFQVISNIFAIIIGMSMAIIALNTYEISQTHYFTFLGLSYGFVAFFDILHILTNPNIGIFNYSMSIHINLWLISRIIQSISLFVSFLNFHFKFRLHLFFLIYLSVSIFSLFIIFVTNIFNPSTFVIMFFAIILISLSIITMFKYKKYFHNEMYYILMSSMVSLLISNSFFINFLGQENIYISLGYIFKIISYYLLYKALNFINLKEPYKTLFYKLNKYNQQLQEKTIELEKVNKKLSILSLKDSLTGLYNRLYFEKEMRLINELGYETLGIVMADLDNMKKVNDSKGHLMGDKYLKDAAKILKSNLREGDTVARIGGDEFAIILYNIKKEDINSLVNRIKNSVGEYNKIHNEFVMSISIGWDLIKIGEKPIEKVLKTADENMYADKYKNKRKNHLLLKVRN
ncbi:sensor domain-containing diguanylate cyclase [Senegalia massiliensis]|uniref:GGDEF domain-containing protein n=1 Tax=Senegalia massiliensis TaxID=1720316 RepID=A0A845QTZ8_9CLOT|nr:GGDEF domain-containing protein [Senegalia massiliensis]NBI05480.1 GGDEF domain-containing protein [Senegalia massiliensis]